MEEDTKVRGKDSGRIWCRYKREWRRIKTTKLYKCIKLFNNKD